jgi:hypothetical protein
MLKAALKTTRQNKTTKAKRQNNRAKSNREHSIHAQTQQACSNETPTPTYIIYF